MIPTAKFPIRLELGDRRHTVCVWNEAGDIVTEETIVKTRACLDVFAARFPYATIVMETGTHSPWISRWFEARGHRMFVANARKVRAISSSQTNFGGDDAEMLARLGRARPKLLNPVTLKKISGAQAGEREPEQVNSSI